MILDFLVQSLRELSTEHEALLSLVVDEIQHQERLIEELQRILDRQPEGEPSVVWQRFTQQIAMQIPSHRSALLTAICSAADMRRAEVKRNKALVRAQLANGRIVKEPQ